jgi:hypothetical protein
MATESKAKRPAADHREVRVFISSTFRDMQEEREELVKQIFPQLRRLCESRGVTWGEVDLRWGVPDEAKAEGKVLPLCLQEIEHCRPYFIGLLGERYGWVPKEVEIPAVLFETQPWLKEPLHQSVTALEIFHGVLGNPEMDKHAFFYFRDPAYAATHPGFTEEDRALREKLASLKEEIRGGGLPVSEPFATPKQPGEWMRRDLTAVIEELYPERTLDPLDRVCFEHEAYSASRRAVYFGRQTHMDRLDAHAAGDGPPLVVAGESGGGRQAAHRALAQMFEHGCKGEGDNYLTLERPIAEVAYHYRMCLDQMKLQAIYANMSYLCSYVKCRSAFELKDEIQAAPIQCVD